MIVIHPSAICNVSQLINAQEQLSIEQFISEPAVERFDITVLARTTWSNIQGLYARFIKPLLYGLRHKLWPIITANISRTASGCKQITQQFNNIFALFWRTLTAVCWTVDVGPEIDGRSPAARNHFVNQNACILRRDLVFYWI